jgi:hypothetical protein
MRPSNCEGLRLRVPIAKLLVRSLRINLQTWFDVVESARCGAVQVFFRVPRLVGRAGRRESWKRKAEAESAA